METVRPAVSRQASETVVARQLNAKFWNPDNSVFQALKVQSKELKIDWAERAVGANESKWCKWSKRLALCLSSRIVDDDVYFGERQSAENSIFSTAISSRFLWESVEKEKLADNLTETVFKWSWAVIRAVRWWMPHKANSSSFDHYLDPTHSLSLSAHKNDI